MLNHFYPKLSQTENTELKNILASMGLYAAWIGISDALSEGAWVDFDGKPLGSGEGTGFTPFSGRFVNWSPTSGCLQDHEPNNCRTGDGEDYAIILASTGAWFDDSSENQNNHVLCQRPGTMTKYCQIIL